MKYEREYVKPNMENYDKTYREFRLNVPEYYNYGFDVIDKWAEDRTKLALLSVDQAGKNPRSYTFWDLKVLSNKFANILRDLGIKKGERIFVMLPRIPEWYVALIGMVKLGVVPCPATTMCTPGDVEYRVNRAEISCVITNSENAGKVEEVTDRCPTLKHKILIDEELDGWINYEKEMDKKSRYLGRDEVEPTKKDDTAILFFTSGTVRYPKMVLHTHSYPAAHYLTGFFAHDDKPTDLDYTITETGWAKSSWATWGQWICGAALFQHDARGKFDADLTLRLIEKYGVTVLCAPPTVYRLMVLEDLSKYDLRLLRHTVGAGEPLNPEVIRVWKENTGLDIHDFYGQTETVPVLSNYRCMPIKLGSMGKPVPTLQVSIVDDDKEVPSGVEGNVAIRIESNYPAGLFKEYWKEPEEMKEVFRGDWYFTGDRAYRDEDGYFWFVGRGDDVILASGYRIGPFEVESALVEHPAVVEAAVVSSPDPTRGEVVKAFVILAPGHKPSEDLTRDLQDHVKKVTAPYKYPRKIEYVEELPKTISGKIKRGELKRKEWEGHTQR